MSTYKNLINNKWCDTDNTADNINPANTNDVIGTYTVGSVDDINRAVDIATQAFDDWSTSNPQVRHDLLDKVGNTILARKDELGTLLAREEGKTLAEAIGEVARAGQVFKFFAGEALRNNGDNISSVRPGVDVMVEREALGVIGIITPWNFPIATPSWKIAPALAFGNTVVFKPAELTPGCAFELTNIIKESGCPDGVFNLVMGKGSQLGAALVEHPKVDAISFTGSTAVGKKIQLAGAMHSKRVQCEMGGKNPFVILDDANIDTALSSSINGSFFSTGQRCTASSRLIITPGIYNEFVDKLQKQMSELVIGDPLDSTTHIGPVSSKEQLEQNISYLKLAQDEGCQVVGGEVIDSQGFMQKPGLFLGASNDLRISREEIFGPFTAIIKANDYDEALALANDTTFGLSAGICTTSLKYATHFRKNAKAGMVMVNLPTAGVDYHVPFGGRKESSYGQREQGRYAREFYTIVKTSYILA